MKKLTLISLIVFIGTFISFAQSQELLKVGDEVVTVEEFERFYLKNNRMVTKEDRKSLEEYFDLFLVYKLKVAEAKSRELDKSEAFIEELNSYRDQLMQPFMVDTLAEQQVIEEAYERMHYEVNASHILISVLPNASPEDTLYKYNKALQIRERILKGEPFENIARATSDDPSVSQNGGTLGYFTAFQMVYPFEKAVYNLEVDSISQPIRSKFGYHIIKLNDKRKNRGQLRVAHIMFITPTNASDEEVSIAKMRADSVYQLVLENHDFAQLAMEYSQDQGSARRGGELQWFGSGRMVPEFESAAFALNNPGDVSKPIRSGFGWHIIKLLERKTIGTFAQELPELKMRISKDDRGKVGQKVYVENKKKELGFVEYAHAVEAYKNLLDSTVYENQWKVDLAHENTILFKLNNQDYTLSQLEKFIQDEVEVSKSRPLYEIAKTTYNAFAENTVLTIAENELMKNNKDFYYLYKEYYDGILLFNIMDEEVWSIASRNREALQNFYNENILNYSWDERLHLKEYKTEDEKVFKKAQKLVKSKKGSALSDEKFLAKVNKKAKQPLTIKPMAENLNSQIVKGYESWENGISDVMSDGKSYRFLRVKELVKNDPIPLGEIKGQVIADLQDYLEKEWVESLRTKHKITVNQKLYNELTSKYK